MRNKIVTQTKSQVLNFSYFGIKNAPIECVKGQQLITLIIVAREGLSSLSFCMPEIILNSL